MAVIEYPSPGDEMQAGLVIQLRFNNMPGLQPTQQFLHDAINGGLHYRILLATGPYRLIADIHEGAHGRPWQGAC